MTPTPGQEQAVWLRDHLRELGGQTVEDEGLDYATAVSRRVREALRRTAEAEVDHYAREISTLALGLWVLRRGAFAIITAVSTISALPADAVTGEMRIALLRSAADMDGLRSTWTERLREMRALMRSVADTEDHLTLALRLCPEIERETALPELPAMG